MIIHKPFTEQILSVAVHAEVVAVQVVQAVQVVRVAVIAAAAVAVAVVAEEVAAVVRDKINPEWKKQK